MMVRSMLRAGAWPAVLGISGVAVVVGGCGVAFPEAAAALLPIAFTLMAAAAAFVLDEPASQVVDVTPTGPVQRTAIRSLALLAPFAVGAALMLAGALRGLELSWAAIGLALAGNVVLGFAVASVARTRTGEPGAPAATGVVLILMAPTLLPPVARRVSTFPTSGGDGLSSNTVWWTVLVVCAAAVAVSVNGRRLRRSMPRPSMTSPWPPRRPARVERVRPAVHPRAAQHLAACGAEAVHGPRQGLDRAGLDVSTHGCTHKAGPTTPADNRAPSSHNPEKS
jgi:hypothetical protein